MAVKFFGQYLIERGVLTAEKLLAALEDQRGRNRRFGSYALQLGYLRPADVQRIQQQQRSVDARFGEVAVQLGLLTPEQVEEILLRQRQDHIMLGELLVERGDISPEVLARELAAFKDDQAPWSTGELLLPADVRDQTVARAMLELPVRLFARTTGEQVKVGEAQWAEHAPQASFAVHVPFRGTQSLAFGIACDTTAAELLTRGLLGDEALLEDAEVIADAVREFANVAAGSILARLAQLGRGYDIQPPVDGMPSLEGGRLLVVAPLSAAGDVRFVVRGL